MQAAGHEIDGEWGKMLKVTERWVAAEPANTEAKRALELARSKLQWTDKTQDSVLHSLPISIGVDMFEYPRVQSPWACNHDVRSARG